MENVIVMVLYVIVFFDLVTTFKKKDKKVSITYTIIFIITFIIINLHHLGVQIPSPSIVIQKFITGIIK